MTTVDKKDREESHEEPNEPVKPEKETDQATDHEAWIKEQRAILERMNII